MYTPDHFSLLRLVGKMSKRVCGLIEQSIKYHAHFADGSKRFRAGRRCAVAGSLGPTGGSEGGLLPGLLDKYVISNN